MKKILAIFLCLVLMLSFVACKTDTNNDKADDDAKVETTDKDTAAKEDADAEDADTTSGNGEYTCDVCGKNITLDDACIIAEAYGQTYMCPDCYADWVEIAK